MTVWMNEHPWFWLSCMLAALAALVFVADLIEKWLEHREQERMRAYVGRARCTPPSHVRPFVWFEVKDEDES